MNSTTRFRALAENASDVVVEGDNTGVIQWVSPSVEALMGWRPDQLVGRPMAELVTEDQLQLLAGVQATVLAGRPASFEARLLRADGTRRWISVSVRPIVDRAGVVVARVAGWRDAHDEVTARSELRLDRQRFELLAENASDVVCLAGPDRRLLWVASTITRTLGWLPEELVGTALGDLVHPDDRQMVQATVRQVYSGDQRATPVEGITARLRTRGGEYRWVSGRATSVVDSEGCVVEVVAGLKDIHDLMGARQRLEEERALLQATIDSLLDPHVLLSAVRDDDRRIVDFEVTVANHAARAFAELPGGVVGFRLSELPAGATLVDRCVTTLTGDKPLVLDGVRLDVDGRTNGRRFDVRATRVRDGLSFTWRDTTDRWLAVQALRRAEEHFQHIAENASDIVFRADLDTRVEWISPSIRRVLGQDPDEIVGHLATEFVHPDDLPAIAASTGQMRADGSARYEARFRRADGSHRWMSVVANAVRNGDGVVVGRAGSFRDIHREVETRAALYRSEQQLASAMNAAPIGLAIVGLDRQFMAVNDALCRLLGRDREWLLDRGIADVVGDDDNEMDLQLRVAARSSEHGTAMSEKRLRTSTGTEVWVEHSVGLITDTNGAVSSYVSQFTDITDARLGREQLRHDATHDALTLLANRRQLVDRAAEILAHPARNDARAALAFIDVDGLKAINDTYGHRVGDQMIMTVAHRIREKVRSHDVVARFGGDEFVVLLPEVGTVDAVVAIADQLRERIRLPIETDGMNLTVSASIGVTLVEPGETIATVLQRADAAMYAAKQAGRDRTVCAPSESTKLSEPLDACIAAGEPLCRPGSLRPDNIMIDPSSVRRRPHR